MPLGERIVTPINLGRSPIKIDHGDRRNLHQAVASNALVGILHQLASVVRLADDIFCDISEECQKVFEKTERISRKISFVEQFVKDLDAKTVTIRKFYTVLFIIGIPKKKIRIHKGCLRGRGCVSVTFGVGIVDSIICVICLAQSLRWTSSSPIHNGSRSR